MVPPRSLAVIVTPNAAIDASSSLGALTTLLGGRRGIRLEQGGGRLKVAISLSRIEVLGPLVEAAAASSACTLRLADLDAQLLPSPLDGRPSGIWAAIGDAVLDAELAEQRGDEVNLDLFRHVRIDIIDGQRRAVDDRPPLVEPTGPGPADFGPVKYDDMDFHEGSTFEAGQQRENAYTHIGFYLVWLIRHDLHNPREFRKALIRDVKLGTLSGSDLIDDTDGKLVSDFMADEGISFSDARYETYLGEYGHLFEAEPDYAVAGNAANYALVEPLLDELYAEWVRVGRPVGR